MLDVRRFRALAYGALVATLAVIVWGAYVRASGSGAGCGSHWPTCNGQVIPRAPSVKTIIELTHRVTSGVSLLLVLAQLVVAFFAFPSGHRVRRGAVASMFFMATEAGVGAGLVLFEMVAQNKSIARAWWMGAHLSNTFFLLGAMALTIFWSYERPLVSPRPKAPSARAIRTGSIFACVGLLVVGITGAIVALGDTLFPASTLAEGVAADLVPGAHFLVKLRVLHPVIASVVGLCIAYGAAHVANHSDDRWVKGLGRGIVALFVAQVAIGFANFALLAPIPLQLVHLLVADLFWIAVVVGGAAAVPLVRPHTSSIAGRIATEGTTA
jgi:cytochrome c oxidase assembly protein subunit 15